MRAVLALQVLVVVALAAGLVASYRQTLSAETEVLQVMARAVAAHVEGTLQTTEATLRATLDEVEERRIDIAGPGFTSLLRERAELLPVFDTLAVVDLSGQVLNLASDGATEGGPTRIRLAAEFALAGRFDLGRVEVLAPATAAEVPRPLLAAALPWAAADGQVRGHIVALADAGFFNERLFQQITGDHTPMLGLWTADGVPLSTGVAQPEDREVGQVLRRTPVTRPTDAALPSPLPSDTLPGLVAVLQPLGAYPLVLSVSRGRDPVLAGWRTQAQAIAGFTLLALIAVGLFAVRSARVSERLQVAEAQACESAARLAERMQTAHRLEALGTLAGGIAHDFNNVLAAVVGFGEMAREAAPTGSAQARHLDQVLQAGLRGRGLIDRILTFSRRRGAAERVRRFEAQPIVAEVIALLRGSLPAQARLQADLQAAEARVDGDPTLLFEIAMNLCTNALHAMPAGGEVWVGLRPVPGPPQAASIELTVRDTGVGIAAEVLPRIFEPFFSRPAGAVDDPGASRSPVGTHIGTGLGLAVVQGAVLALGGAIEVQSRLGQGSTFTVRLPVAAPDQAAADAAPSAADVEAAASEGPPPEGHAKALALPLGQGQTVMWVDDKPGLVAYGEELLAGLGYEPIGFDRPVQALAALRQDPSRFDAVITDQVMPELSGLDLAQEAHALRPELPVLLVSGQDSLAQAPPTELRLAAAALVARLPKPIDRVLLAQALQQALTRDPQGHPAAEGTHAEPAPKG